jgi:PAS domain S-box-containing protein
MTVKKCEHDEIWLNIVNTFSDIVVLTDDTGHILKTNKSGEIFTGISSEKMVGKSCCKLFHGSKKRIPDCPMRKMIQTGQRADCEYCLSEGKWISISVEPVHNKEGNITNAVHIIRDITQQKTTEETLKESERKFKDIFDNANDAITYLDCYGKILDVNKQVLGIYGGAKKDLINKHFTKLNMLSLKDVPKYVRLFKSILKGEKAAVTVNIDNKKGEKRIIECSASLIKSDAGPSRIMVISRDITERRQTLDKLLESEQRLRSIIDHSVELFYIHDTNYQLTYVSPQCKTIFGYTPEEMLVNWTNFVTDNPLNKRVYELTEKAIKTEQKQNTYLLEIKRKDGQLRIVEIDESPLKNEKGKVIGITGALRDITEHKHTIEALRESEEKFRNLAEQSPNMIFINKKGKVVYTNKRSSEILGYTREEYYADDFDFLCLIAPESIEKIKLAFSKHLKERDVEPYEYTLISKSGERIESIITTRLIDYEGTKSILGIVTDITERKQAEELHLAHLRFMESMDRINRAIQKTNDLEQMMSDVLDVVLSIFDCERVYLMYPCDPQADSWTVPMERSKPEFEGPVYTQRLNVPMEPNVTEMIRIILDTKGPVEFGPGTAHPMSEFTTKRHSFQSMLTTALYPKAGKTWQLGIHQISKPRIWTDEEVRLFQGISRRLEDALTSLLMYRDLQERENKYRELADSITNIFFAMDQNLRYTYWNKAFENITGIRAKDALGKSHLDIFPGSSWEKRAENVYRDVLRTQQPQTFVDKVDFGNNSYILEINVYPSLNGLSVFIKDITEQRKVQEALQISQAQLSQVLKTAKIGYWEYDIKERMFIFNDQFYFVYHTSAEEVGGYKMSLERYAGLFMHPEDIPSFYDMVQTVSKAPNVLLNVQREHRVKFGDGKTGYILVNIMTKSDDKGRIVKAYGANQDITERKKAEDELIDSEARYHSLFNNANDAIFLMDFDTFIDCNNKTFEIYNCTKKQIIGEKPYALFSPELQPDGRSSKEKALEKIKLAHKGQSQFFEWRHLKYDGTTFDAEVSLNKIELAGKIYLQAMVRDITVRKKAEENILRYQEQLKSLASQLTLTEEKERYRIATAIHDQIGQYLAVSRIKLTEILQTAAAEAKKNLEQIDEWLDHAMEESHSLTFDLSSPILHELGIERAIAAWLEDEVQEKHKIKTQFQTDGLVKVLDNDIRVLLFRNVKELLFNAVKHAHAKRVKVSIRKKNNNIQIKVEDDGVGFNPDEVAATAAINTKFGLFSIRERLEHFGGNIEIDSAPGKGCKITLIAPLKKA